MQSNIHKFSHLCEKYLQIVNSFVVKWYFERVIASANVVLIQGDSRQFLMPGDPCYRYQIIMTYLLLKCPDRKNDIKSFTMQQDLPLQSPVFVIL